MFFEKLLQNSWGIVINSNHFADKFLSFEERPVQTARNKSGESDFGIFSEFSRKWKWKQIVEKFRGMKTSQILQ